MDRIRRAYENLKRVAQMLSQAASRGAGARAGGAPPAEPREGEVVDAEFTDTDEHDQRKAS
jgi:hypothetical protein